MYSRNIPPTALYNPLSFRPVITKYTEVVRPLPNAIDDNISFTVQRDFSPGDRMAPFHGYQTAVDVESVLRDQVSAIGTPKQYSPNVLGDLYNSPVPHIQDAMDKDFPYLFKNPSVATTMHHADPPTRFAFNNSSRTY
jgi:hypothetical protein